ncbi:MAG TPA: ArsB/NhaD family transporter [Syntrophothermus lipocalidus]|uniref:Citrate transporter n=1 Tax=Syntrophothermus lipocalidus (strain DSM 12680 / TGB-C1) TaxID=643648 RepID=D7CP10_SYNLT|nr:Citrate transporter [Syntrophothermus lipocalidus DSM 12680]HHV77743.1 ArsB/NhaD family transporter [Syntrophothermus lipocalidus]
MTLKVTNIVNWETGAAVVIFFTVYFLIVSEKIHRAVAALLGAGAVIWLGIVTQAEAVRSIDFNTIGLLVGMMIIVGITKRSGLFEFLAIWSAQKTKGNPVRILIALSSLTAIASAFLDNVTTVLLIVPVTFAITDELGLNPFPFLFSEVLASNIGGTATLIGDPPNIMIGSGAGLGFLDFLFNLTPVIVVVFLCTLGLCAVIFRKDLQLAEEKKQTVLEFGSRDAHDYIKDYLLLKRSLTVLGLVIVAFVLHQWLGLESATIALGGAALLMLIMPDFEPEEALLTVEWPTIFFFIGLFIVVGALEKVGVIRFLAHQAIALTGGKPHVMAMTVLWTSALFSSFVDNIPFTATMIPLLKSVGTLSGADLGPLWWALSLGACLGGNGTLIGASANLVVAGIAARQGLTITFKEYFKYGFPLMLVSIIISTVYIWVRYLT